MKINSLFRKVILILMLAMSGCQRNIDTIDDNYRVFYEIFVGSFSDSNNDGIGDLEGIIKRLDYLNDGNVDSDDSLHVQGIWLSPIFKSPSYHKYDAQDYYQIDEDFGTMNDLKELIKKAHDVNVKVILDLAINHTSNYHQWFIEFTNAHRNKDTQNKYYDYYVHVTETEKQKNHSYCQIPYTDDEYYECNFSSDMPELNYDNEEVRKEVLDIARYYLELGIDGFRFDAIKYIYYLDNEKTISFWNWYMDELKQIKSDIYVVGEDWSADSEILQYTKAMDCFNFSMAQAEGKIAATVKGANINFFTNYVSSYQEKMLKANEEAMFKPFISNHDMDRAAGYLNVSSGDAYMAANLYLLSPGSPFIYYGEEIGLKGSRGSENTDANRRLKMLWGDDDTIEDPEGAAYIIQKQVNGTVSDQLKNDDSLLKYYIKLIQARNRHPQIARGKYTQLILDNTKVGGFVISYEDETILLIHNTAKETISIDLNKYVDESFNKIADQIGLGQATLKDGILEIGERTSVIIEQ